MMDVTSKDRALMFAMVKLRLATAELLSAVLATSEQMIRRRCRKLASDNLLKVESRMLPHARGRPELIYGLAPDGVTCLKEAGSIGMHLDRDLCQGDALVTMAQHQLDLNWVLHRSLQPDGLQGPVELKAFSSTSALDLDQSGQSIVNDHVDFKNGKTVPFIPDGVVCIGSSARKKGLLFFLEIDGGTEPLTSSKKGVNDRSIAKKLVIYRNYLIRKGHRRYSGPSLFDIAFQGFRLLLIAPNPTRLKSLCRVVRDMEPLGFVWCVDIHDIKTHGFWGCRWIVEGFSQNRRKLVSL